MDKVTLKCTRKGCPRTVKLPFDKHSMPRGCVTIVSPCPWHAKEGVFGGEQCFDADGNELHPDDVMEHDNE